MRPEDILVPTPSGVCCKLGGFHIDPTQVVERAVITHAHSDHARAGHGSVLATRETLDLMRLRYGENFAGSTQIARYGETIDLGGVKVTFHPAGHVLGSAQIAVQANGLRIVASGDYKDVADPTCAPFELVKCDVFVTEATFGLPVFRHGDPDGEVAKLLRSVALFPERAHLVGAYSLGKAQRVIALIRKAGYAQPIYLHGALESITRYYQGRGIALGELRAARDADKAQRAGAIVLCPPSALNELWSRRFPDPVAAFASGWMRVRARGRQRGIALPLVISDHADWDGLTATITATRTKPTALLSPARRHEPLRAFARPPRLRGRPQQQAAADDRIFPHRSGSRARMGARRLDRRLDVPACQAGHHPGADCATDRRGPVRFVLRLCGRSVGNRRPDVAGTAT